MTTDPYVYPGTDVLRNALDIRDATRLRQLEADLTRVRIVHLSQRRLDGWYDLKHLQAFHRFLFEGLYDWAGETRTVRIAKSDVFCLPQHISSFAATTFSGLASDQYLQGRSRPDFVDGLATHLGEVNALHPFREGNGRAQRAFFAQLASDAGYVINWAGADRARNEAACMASIRGDDSELRKMLDELVEPLR